jgi:hypothetical protein
MGRKTLKAKAATLAMALAVSLAGCATSSDVAESPWRPLFDGESLTGWTPKIAGLPSGEDQLRTFRVQDGAIVVSYEGYGGKFAGRFGHLFYKAPFRAYRLSLKYRVVGEPVVGTPSYAVYNSGVMIFAQAPETMALHQAFPVSAEAQILGPSGASSRTTGNVCTPGTNIHMEGAPVRAHCVNSKEPAPPNGVWTEMQIEVSPAGKVTQFINGAPVLTYERVELDPKDASARPLIAARGGVLSLTEGYIALQSEGQPIEFRDIRIKPYN